MRSQTNERGESAVSGVPAGRVALDARLAGFTTGSVTFDLDGQPVAVDVVLAMGLRQETVTVPGESPRIDVSRTTPTQVTRGAASARAVPPAAGTRGGAGARARVA